MAKRPRILFLSHSASRNGATIMLLNWLRWLRSAVDWDLEVLVHGRGPLVDDLRSVVRTTVWRDRAFLLGMAPRRHRAAWQARLSASSLKALLLGRGYDLVYANTAAVWPHVAALAGKAPALLWHIHELGYALRVLIPRERADTLFRRATGFVAVSRSVRDTLVHDYHVPAGSVDLVHGFVPTPDLTPEARRARRVGVRQRLGWPDDAFVVGGCGTLGWRKGTDLFVQAARRLTAGAGDQNVRFLWVGGGEDEREALEFDHDVAALGLGGRCQRVPTTADVLAYYAAMDVFALTSREDPFPLVMLEAGAEGVPVVCFADAGGAAEFVRDDAGLIAPYLDVPAFADHVQRLREAPALRQRCGAVAARRVRAEHSLEAQAPRLLVSIERQLARRHGARASLAAATERLVGRRLE